MTGPWAPCFLGLTATTHHTARSNTASFAARFPAWVSTKTETKALHKVLASLSGAGLNIA